MCWIKLHTKIKDWRWWGDSPTMCVWIHILIEANWKDKPWKNITVPRGSLVTSREHLAESCGLSVMQVRRALNNLISTGEITKTTTNKYTIISICKYEDYQLSESALYPTNNQQITNKQPQPKNNRKKDNTSTNTLIGNNNLIATNNLSLVVAKSKDFSTESKDLVLKKRAKIFAESIRPYIERYGKEMCREFWEYWTEPNKSHTKMRFEMERTWDIARRLGYWNNRKGMAGKNKAETEPVSKYREAMEQAARMHERLSPQQQEETQIDYGVLRQISEV